MKPGDASFGESSSDPTPPVKPSIKSVSPSLRVVSGITDLNFSMRQPYVDDPEQPDIHQLVHGQTWLNALSGRPAQGQLVCVCGEQSSPAESLALINFVCESLRQSQDTLVISATASAKEYLRRLACARAGLSYRKIQEGFSTPAKMAQAIASAEALACEPLYVAEPVDSPLPPLSDFIEKQLDAMNAALITPRLVVIQGVERFLDDAPEGQTLEDLLLRLRELACRRGITLVILHPLQLLNDDTPQRLTRAQWIRRVPPEIIRHSDLCLLFTGGKLEREYLHHHEGAINSFGWWIHVLKRAGGGSDALPVRQYDDSERLGRAIVDGFRP